MVRQQPVGTNTRGTTNHNRLRRVDRWLAGPWRLRGLGRPSEIAERLPKSLIHRNVPGERVHAWLAAIDTAWDHAAHHAGFGVRQRFTAAATALRGDGWPVFDGPARWRLGELTVAWDAVAPGAGAQRA